MKTPIIFILAILFLFGCGSKTSETNTSQADSLANNGDADKTPSEISNPGLSEAQEQLDKMLKNLIQYENPGQNQFTRILVIADGEFASDSSLFLYDQAFKLRAFLKREKIIMDTEGTMASKLGFVEYSDEKAFRYWTATKKKGQYEEGIFGLGKQNISYFKVNSSGDERKVVSSSGTGDLVFPDDVASFVLENKDSFKPGKSGTYQFYEQVGESSASYTIDSILFVNRFLKK